MENKMITGIATAIIIMLLAYPYTQIIQINDRLIGLEKDKEYLTQIFESKLEGCEDS